MDNLIKGVREKVEINPSYKPDIHFGSKATNNNYLKETVEYKRKETEINSELNKINSILFSISQKKVNPQVLLESVEKLKNLIATFKKKYGEDVEFDHNSVDLLKSSPEFAGKTQWLGYVFLSTIILYSCCKNSA